MIPFEFRHDLWHQKTRIMGLSCGVVCVILRLAVFIQYRSATDTQTHRHTTTANTALSIASRGKKYAKTTHRRCWTAITPATSLLIVVVIYPQRGLWIFGMRSTMTWYVPVNWMSSKRDFIYYGRMIDCWWVSCSLLTYDPQRLTGPPGEASTWWVTRWVSNPQIHRLWSGYQ